MLRVDGAYLYQLGVQLRPISSLAESECARIDIFFECLGAKNAIQEFLYDSVFRDAFRASAQAASRLLSELNILAPEIDPNVNFSELFPAWRIASLKTDFNKFEAVLVAELQGAALYFASAKGGYDTRALTDMGEALFPPSLAMKVPDALTDVRAGARCLAFDLPTAAAFHLHRANESVLRRYFDEVAGFDNRPASSNMGDYLNALKTKKLGDPKVLGALQTIKDLHRNPIMHPEECIETVDEAISLLSAIRAAIGYMLDRIESEHAPVVAPLPLGI